MAELYKWSNDLKTRYIIVAIAFVSFSSLGHAASVDFGYTATSSLFTANDGTQQEWLHLDQTTGLSYNNVVAQLGTGGLYDGWKMARLAEVGRVTSEVLGWDWSDRSIAPGWNEQYVGHNKGVTNIFGSSYSVGGESNWVHGRTADTFIHGPGMTYTRTLASYEFFTYTLAETQYIGEILVEEIALTMSTFLYRDVIATPIPAAAFMFAPALLGFMGLRRKAKNSVA